MTRETHRRSDVRERAGASAEPARAAGLRRRRLVTVASFVRWYEEPTLARQFGEQYQAYRRAVPAWRPRIRPWHQD